jgi:hypothetical protein
MGKRQPESLASKASALGRTSKKGRVQNQPKPNEYEDAHFLEDDSDEEGRQRRQQGEEEEDPEALETAEEKRLRLGACPILLLLGPGAQYMIA